MTEFEFDETMNIFLTLGVSEDDVLARQHGFVVVPKEPTRGMLDAAYNVTKLAGDAPKGFLSKRNKMRLRYRAMIDAWLQSTA